MIIHLLGFDSSLKCIYRICKVNLKHAESHNRVRSKTEKWLESTNFIIDSERELMGHMIYVDDEIKEGLGYHQMNLYAPIKLREG